MTLFLCFILSWNWNNKCSITSFVQEIDFQLGFALFCNVFSIYTFWRQNNKNILWNLNEEISKLANLVSHIHYRTISHVATLLHILFSFHSFHNSSHIKINILVCQRHLNIATHLSHFTPLKLIIYATTLVYLLKDFRCN